MDSNGNKNSTKKVTVIGFGPRLLATLIDSAMVGFLGFTVILVISLIVIFVNIFKPEQLFESLAPLLVVGVLILSIFYFVGFWTGGGQTMGMTVLGMKVVTSDGSQLSTGKALLRYFGYILNAILLSIGFLWVAYDPKRQGWHDKIAGTLVVYVGDEFSPSDKVDFVPSDIGHKGWIWAVLWAASALLLPIGGLAALFTVGPFIAFTLASFIQK